MENERDPRPLPAGTDAAFVEDLYFRFLSDPNSVDASWQELFGGEAPDPAQAAKNGGASWGRARSFQFEEEIPQPRPMAVGDSIEVRPMMYLALSYDHRIVDGQGAVTFLVRIKESLEDPQRMLLDL